MCVFFSSSFESLFYVAFLLQFTCWSLERLLLFFQLFCLLLSCCFITRGQHINVLLLDHMMQSFCFSSVFFFSSFIDIFYLLLFLFCLPYLLADFSASIYLIRWATAVIDKLSSLSFCIWCQKRNANKIFAQHFVFVTYAYKDSVLIWQDALAITVHRRCDFYIIDFKFSTLKSCSLLFMLYVFFSTQFCFWPAAHSTSIISIFFFNLNLQFS